MLFFFSLLGAFSANAKKFTHDEVNTFNESDTAVSVFGGVNKDVFIGKGELWLKNWGVSAQLLQSDETELFGLPKNSQFMNLDVKRRFGSTEKSNIELGLGWQEFNIDSQLNARGPRLSLSGKLNVVPSVKLYGQTSFFPDLENSFRSKSNTSAFEVEAGVLYQASPSISLKAGYRHFSLDLEDPEIEDIGSRSGFLLGTDWSW